MVEAVPAQKNEAAAAQQQIAGMPTADEKRRLKEIHDKFLQDLKKKQQEVVMKFKRSNDAVLSVYVPQSFNGQGCIDCAADHNVRSKYMIFYLAQSQI